MRRLNLLLLGIFLFSLTFTSAVPETWKYNYLESGDQVQFGGSYNISVNSTDKWETNEGILDNVADILHNLLDSASLLWSNAGHTIDTDIDMNDNAITELDHIDWDLTESHTPQEGRLSWDADDGTLALGMPGGNVNLQIGQEMVFRAKNVYGSQIDNGELVYISGATGNIMEVSKGNATHSQHSLSTIAFATEDVANNQQGYFTTTGLVRDINTSAYAEGTSIFLDIVDGQFTNIPPSKPARTVFVGFVTRSHATEGVIFAKIIAIPRIEELSDVENNCSTGEVLGYNSVTEIWGCLSIVGTEYNASTIQTLTGTVDSGNLTSIQTRDNIFYNVSEVSGTPGFEIQINYTGVETFNDIVARLEYDGSPAHNIFIQLQRCSDGGWDTEYTFSDTDGVIEIVEEVLDPSDHICTVDQNVSLRIIHDSSGNPAHDIYLDAVHLVRGATTASPTEVDPLSIHKSGDVTWEGNDNHGGFNITNVTEISIWANASVPEGETLGHLVQDGTNDHVYSTTYGGITGTAQRSFSVWLRHPETFSTAETTLYYGSESAGKRFNIISNANDTIGLAIATANRYFTATGLMDGQWHHIVVNVPDSATLNDISIYMDNVSLSEKSSVVPTTAINTGTAYKWSVGARTYDHGNSWNGDIDNVMLFNTTLNTSQISDIYLENRTTYDGSYENVELLWLFDGTPNDFSDSSGNGRDGIGYDNAYTMQDSVGFVYQIGQYTISEKDGNLHIDSLKGVVYINGSVSATGYETRTPKEKRLMSLLKNYVSSLPDDLGDCLDEEGTIKSNCLLSLEKGITGHFKVDAMAMVNRFLILFLIDDYLETKQEVKQLKDKEAQRDACWDLNTQAEIIACMREI